jgi:GT2 family glycosyltransferase
VQECLASLRGQVLTASREIILVDNASTDSTLDLVRQQFPEVNVIENSVNLGFAKATNAGIRASRGRYIFLINSDVNVPSTCLQNLYTFMERESSAGMVGPRMRAADGNVYRSYMRFPTLWNCLCRAFALDIVFKHNSLFGGNLMADFDNERTADVDVLNGWFLAVRREAVDSVGLLDETFFMYGEDIDWSYRFHQAGWRRIYFSGASALHYGGASSARAALRFYIQMQRANFRYWRKRRGSLGVLEFWITAFLHHGIRLLAYTTLYALALETSGDIRFKMRRNAACLAWLLGMTISVPQT